MVLKLSTSEVSFCRQATGCAFGLLMFNAINVAVLRVLKVRGHRFRRIAYVSAGVVVVFVILKNLDLSSKGEVGYKDAQQRREADVIRRNEYKHLLCVLVPYRERLEELQVFAPQLKRFLDAQYVPFRMFVLNQTDQYRFNRASLINVGWFEVRNSNEDILKAQRVGCDYMCMHDVDLLPLNPHLDYGFPGDGPYHVASPEYHPRYKYNQYVGGILIITMEQYELVNGMSNKYWGWGLEDDEFYMRLKDANLTDKLRRPTNLKTNRSNTFNHIHEETVRNRDAVPIGNQYKLSRERDRLSGLKTVRYEVLSRIPMTIEDASLIMVNVKLECDLSWTPYCLSSTTK